MGLTREKRSTFFGAKTDRFNSGKRSTFFAAKTIPLVELIDCGDTSAWYPWSMYYLSQSGDVLGPFGERKILEMSDAGEIGPGAQVTRAGSEDWFPADDLLSGLWAERKERAGFEKRQESSSAKMIQKWAGWKWARLLFFLVAVILLIMGCAGQSGNRSTAAQFERVLDGRLNAAITLATKPPGEVLVILRRTKQSGIALDSGDKLTLELLEAIEKRGGLDDPSAKQAMQMGLKITTGEVDRELSRFRSNQPQTFSGSKIAIGLIFLFVAIIPTQRKYLCGNCGNSLEKTSTICPSCQSRMERSKQG